MKLQILTYPDKRLREKSTDVIEFDEHLHDLLDSMYEIMIESNGIGLAAIQVGHPKNMLIINLPNENDEQLKENLLEIINPIITYQDGEAIYQEGCLSVPGIYEDVKRFDQIAVKYQNRFQEEQILEASGLLSIAIQHEIDHLQGKLFIDKLSYSKRKKVEKEYKKLQKNNKNKTR